MPWPLLMSGRTVIDAVARPSETSVISMPSEREARSLASIRWACSWALTPSRYGGLAPPGRPLPGPRHGVCGPGRGSPRVLLVVRCRSGLVDGRDVELEHDLLGDQHAAGLERGV